MKSNEIFIESARILRGKESKHLKINKLINKIDKGKELKKLQDKYPDYSIYFITIEK
jgi:uncharacterized protein (DUF2249 family)